MRQKDLIAMRSGHDDFAAITATGDMINFQDYSGFRCRPFDYGPRPESTLLLQKAAQGTPQKVAPALPRLSLEPDADKLTGDDAASPSASYSLMDWRKRRSTAAKMRIKNLPYISPPPGLSLEEDEHEELISTPSTIEHKSPAASIASSECQESGPELQEDGPLPGCDDQGATMPSVALHSAFDGIDGLLNEIRHATAAYASQNLEMSDFCGCGISDAGAPPIPWRLISNYTDQMVSRFHQSLSHQDCVPKDVLHSNCQTLIIKHIPCRCSQKEVMDAVAALGFGDLYNFFYLPIRRVHMRNFGYAFIGFPDANTTQRFAVAMTGYRFPCRRSPKACAVAPAHIQGFGDDVEKMWKSRSMWKLPRPSN